MGAAVGALTVGLMVVGLVVSVLILSGVLLGKPQAPAAKATPVDQARRAVEAAVLAILPVYDSLERAIYWEDADAGPEAVAAALAQFPAAHVLGLHQTVRLFDACLAELGVTPMASIGHDFDPRLHDAVSVVPPVAPGLVGKVVDIMERGFMVGGRVLRPAKVVVAKDLPQAVAS